MSKPRVRTLDRVASGPGFGSALNLTGRVALMTGAGRGLGSAIARGLADAGADLILWARDARAVERRAAELAASGRHLVAQSVDVRNQSAVRLAMKQALRVSDASTCWLIMQASGVEMTL